VRIERMVSLWVAFTVASHAASSARMRQAGAPARCSVWVTPHATCRGLPLEDGGAAVHGVVAASMPPTKQARNDNHFWSQRRPHLGKLSCNASSGSIPQSVIELVPRGTVSAIASAARLRVRQGLVRPDGVSQLRSSTESTTRGLTGVLGFAGQRPGALWPARLRPPGFRRWGRMAAGVPGAACARSAGSKCIGAPIACPRRLSPLRPLLPTPRLCVWSQAMAAW
jgi:hypothetical protein